MEQLVIWHQKRFCLAPMPRNSNITKTLIVVIKTWLKIDNVGLAVFQCTIQPWKWHEYINDTTFIILQDFISEFRSTSWADSAVIQHFLSTAQKKNWLWMLQLLLCNKPSSYLTEKGYNLSYLEPSIFLYSGDFWGFHSCFALFFIKSALDSVLQTPHKLALKCVSFKHFKLLFR